MKDEIISIDEAARLIGTTRSAVGKWAAEGALSTVTTRTRRKLVYRSEILEIKALRDKGKQPRRVADDVIMLSFKVKKLERLMDAITTFMRIPDRLITFSDEELLLWHDQAKRFVMADKFDAKRFDFSRWLGVLKNLHEEEFRRISLLKNDSRPFIPFLKLCERIIGLAKLRKHKKISKTVAYSHWLYLFLQARNTLRDRALALLAEEEPDADPFRVLEEALSPQHPPVLAMLKMRQQGGKV